MNAMKARQKTGIFLILMLRKFIKRQLKNILDRNKRVQVKEKFIGQIKTISL